MNCPSVRMWPLECDVNGSPASSHVSCLANLRAPRMIKVNFGFELCKLPIPADYQWAASRPATHTDFISIYGFFTLRIWQNTDFLP